ncbi:hypothetical protein, partial [Bacteroides uniformis]|uniref:hypothetical protein n=1 Tax=Bacteroides uniformis TaxID=820 RepID=UPI001AA197BC
MDIFFVTTGKICVAWVAYGEVMDDSLLLLLNINSLDEEDMHVMFSIDDTLSYLYCFLMMRM